jgi:hypothetical protein
MISQRVFHLTIFKSKMTHDDNKMRYERLTEYALQRHTPNFHFKCQNYFKHICLCLHFMQFL